MDKTNKTKNLAYCALFTALIAVGAFIRVPVPVVPFTLQYLFTMLAGLLLGPRLGTIAVGTYVLLGLVGLPIFTQGGGFWYVFQPSFGYLIGFCVGTFVTGWLASGWSRPERTPWAGTCWQTWRGWRWSMPWAWSTTISFVTTSSIPPSPCGPSSCTASFWRCRGTCV